MDALPVELDRFCLECGRRCVITADTHTLGRALLAKAKALSGSTLDVDLPWMTDAHGNTYAGDKHHQVSDSYVVAALVDSANILLTGKVRRVRNRNG